MVIFVMTLMASDAIHAGNLKDIRENIGRLNQTKEYIVVPRKIGEK